MAAMILTGDKALDKKLGTLKNSVVRKVAGPAVNKALAIMAKAVKAQVPPSQKSIKKTVGKRFNKAKTGEAKGMVVAKVGFAVGRKRKGGKKKERSGKPGVGISANNVHWAVLGTKDRQTVSGQKRGEMRPIAEDMLKRGVNSSMSGAMETMRDTVRENLKKLATS